MTLSDVALRLNVPWRQLVREIAAEVERGTGRAPRVADAPRRITGDERRLGELREIVAGLEAGRSLREMADRWKEATADLEQAETAALEAALSSEAAPGRDADRHRRGRRRRGRRRRPSRRRRAIRSSCCAARPSWSRQLCAGLGEELERLGGSPARRRWQRERPLVARLVERLSSVELRFRREQQAWFPALQVHGVDGPQALLAARQREALESLRRLAARGGARRRRLRRRGRRPAARRARRPARARRAPAGAAGAAGTSRPATGRSCASSRTASAGR